VIIRKIGARVADLMLSGGPDRVVPPVGVDVFRSHFGLFSLGDALCELLRVSGPSDLEICTWSADLADSERLLRHSNLRSLKVYSSKELKSRHGDFYDRLVGMGATFEEIKTHAKWARISGGSRQFAVMTSHNLEAYSGYADQIEVTEDLSIAEGELNGGSAAEIVGACAEGVDAYAVAKVAMLELLEAVVRRMPGADVTIQTWTVSQDHAAAASALVASGAIRSLRFLVTFLGRLPDLGGVEFSKVKVHGKSICARKGDQALTILTSGNLNRAVRTESIHATTCPEVARVMIETADAALFQRRGELTIRVGRHVLAGKPLSGLRRPACGRAVAGSTV
jgi:hypothetical protein